MATKAEQEQESFGTIRRLISRLMRRNRLATSPADKPPQAAIQPGDIVDAYVGHPGHGRHPAIPVAAFSIAVLVSMWELLTGAEVVTISVRADTNGRMTGTLDPSAVVSR